MPSTSTRRPRRTGKKGAVADARRAGDGRLSPRTRVLLAAGAALVVAALAVAVVAGGDDSSDTETATAAPVTTEGAALPARPDTGDDPAIGAAWPTLTGTDLAGDPLTIGGTGRATMVVFLAHWCPHCQAEVPVIVDWLADGGLPDDVDLVAVATANDERRPNYPADDWLAREGWDAPTLLDDADATAATAGGVSSFPFMVFVGADGRVVSRAAGELTPAELSEHVDALVEGT